MPIRNPFARRPGAPLVQDENVRPGEPAPAHPGFERVDTVGSKASSAVSIASSKSQDTGEYKMSVVNDSGIYLPPSPIEDKAPWPTRYLSRNSSDTRSSIAEIEHFSISRESFDSYRRSFDITARSPIMNPDVPTRQSLDSARFPRLPRTALDRRAERAPPTTEEAFEDVGLDDKHQPAPHHRKRGFFLKFGDSAAQEKEAHGNSAANANTTSPAVSRFLLPGRKRGQSGQGSELGHIERPKTATTSVETREVHN